MNALNILLDKAKETRSLPSDNALAGLLGVSRQRVSAWRHGTNYPDPVACARIAEITGEPLARVLGVVGEARALSTEEKKVWRRLATAATIGVAFLMPFQTPAGTLTGGESMHYAKLRAVAFMRRVFGWLAARTAYAPALLAAR